MGQDSTEGRAAFRPEPTEPAATMDGISDSEGLRGAREACCRHHSRAGGTANKGVRHWAAGHSLRLRTRPPKRGLDSCWGREGGWEE